jgi:multidrug efflux pump subunit AcrB
MWIVRLALRRPYTFVVVSILIVIMGGLAIVRTPTDIFPNINIPVISIIWNYNGLVPEDMSDRIVSVTERALTTTVDNIEHIESQSLYGIAVVKVFLQPTANVQQGIGVPGKSCTRGCEANWYGRSLQWDEERSIRRSRS